MYNYIKGTVVDQTSALIVVDNNGIGYDVYVSNPYAFEIGKEYKVYLYHHITENSQTLFGFKTEAEKELFLKLINVKGLGPKIALPMFATGSPDGIIDAIDRENVLYLTKFPKVGDKLARQIILDLKGKLAVSGNESARAGSNELVEVLDNLGYKKPEIKKVLPNIDYTKSLEEQIKDALRLMLK